MHTANGTKDEELYQIGAELAFGTESIGQVLDVDYDPISHRVWRLITTYGPRKRRVAVPVEWVVRRTPTRVTLAVGTHSLDDLADQRDLGQSFTSRGNSSIE